MLAFNVEQLFEILSFLVVRKLEILVQKQLEIFAARAKLEMKLTDTPAARVEK